MKTVRDGVGVGDVNHISPLSCAAPATGVVAGGGGVHRGESRSVSLGISHGVCLNWCTIGYHPLGTTGYHSYSRVRMSFHFRVKCVRVS
jgi:hypothetical protein